MKRTNLLELSQRIRLSVLKMCYRAHVGHIGSALSVADILAVLYGKTLSGKIADSKRDRFILSKGHAVGALYAALAETDRIPKKICDAYCRDGSDIGMHPDAESAPWIEWTTGSLGHGLASGAGMALGSKNRVFVLVSDAELNEGSTWETVMFAGHHHLDNLTMILDANGQQAFGKTADVLDLSPIPGKFASFGWSVRSVNGHDLDALDRVFAAVPFSGGKPSLIVARTVSGYPVSFMKGKIDWHYWPMNEQQYRQAQKEIEMEKRIGVRS